MFAALGLLAFAESVEFVAHCRHEIACQRVVAHVLHVVGGDVAHHVGALSEYVVSLEADGERAVAQEFVGYRGIPHPFLCVVALRIAAGGGVVEVGVEHQAERRVVAAVEGAAVGVDGAVGALQIGRAHV